MGIPQAFGPVGLENPAYVVAITRAFTFWPSASIPALVMLTTWEEFPIPSDPMGLPPVGFLQLPFIANHSWDQIQTLSKEISSVSLDMSRDLVQVCISSEK